MGTINTAHHHTTTTASSSSSSSFSTATAKLDALLFLLELVSFYLSHSPCTTIAHLQHCLQKCVIAPFSIKYNTIRYNTIQYNATQYYTRGNIHIARFHRHHQTPPSPYLATNITPHPISPSPAFTTTTISHRNHTIQPPPSLRTFSCSYWSYPSQPESIGSLFPHLHFDPRDFSLIDYHFGDLVAFIIIRT